MQRDWELERLQNATGEERQVPLLCSPDSVLINEVLCRAELVNLVDTILLERLKQPHSSEYHARMHHMRSSLYIYGVLVPCMKDEHNLAQRPLVHHRFSQVLS